MEAPEWSAADQMPISIDMSRNSHIRSLRYVFLTVVIAVILIGAGAPPLLAQDNAAQDPAEATLRRGFRDLLLGLPFNEAQQLLQSDPAFQYRGEPDVSLRLSDGGTVIDTRGRVYMERGIFQFHEARLFAIALYLDRTRLDYFQLYEQFRERYGEPVDLDPQRALWEDQQTRIELERPLTVRYLDLETFEARRQESRTEQAAEDVAREQFLEEF
ncbi:MAG TPA: hypothetical protein VJ932_11660 [Alkalispirochaeta sp.]|nr:hypothetical protein [Alkalispirochaeta sp.]